jgi:UDP-GlcNAc:undecaprenyl-phosphate/decaprenyl-phosphate GlcNAc-1-phosphate transferase
VNRATVFGLLAFALGLGLTRLAEEVARRTGVVARPSADRWSRDTVPLLGGVAIVVATLAPALVAARHDFRLAVLAVTASAMAAVGLVDDVRRLGPQTKLLAQLALASVLIYFSFVVRLTGHPFADMVLTLVWIVGITNAFNLLDNMDGLSGTVALVAASFRLLFFSWDGETTGVLVSASFIGAVAGFLVRNAPPAKIFMGDAGSLFLGFFLAGLCLVAGSGPYSRGVVGVLVLPVLLLAIPIFDTAFVTVTRLLGGRRVDVGGRDHTSHRLVAIGLSERHTVLVLAGLSIAGGSVAALSYRVGLSYTVVLLALLVIGLVLLGIHLSRVRPASSRRNGDTILTLVADFQYKRQVLTLLLDGVLLTLAYYAACLLRFEEELASYLPLFYRSLPVVIPVQLLTLGAFGLYRGVWQFTSIPDLVRITKATAVGTAAGVIVLVYIERFVGFSRTVFVLDWLVLLFLIAGSRLSFRLFGEVLRARPQSFGRVLVYGAGAGGELVVRELLNNAGLRRVPVGFVDDDRAKHGTRIHGLPIFGGSDQIETVVAQHGVEEVFVSSAKIHGHEFERAADTCRRLGIQLRRATLQLE